MIDGIKTNDDLTPEEERLAELLFEVKDDESFVNDVMTMADYQELIKETADFIEGNHQCTESDVLEFLASFVTVVMVEE